MPNSPILDGLDRPSSPTNWKRTDWKVKDARVAGLFPPPALVNPTHENFSYDFAWHHNIPWKTLRDSFKVAVVFCDWDVLEGLLDLYGLRLYPAIKRKINLGRDAIFPRATHASGATYEKWVNRLSGEQGSLLDHLPTDKQLTTLEADTIAESVAWQRWNIVEGPKESVRVDDPGSDGFDDFSVADPIRISRYMAIKRLYNVLVEVEADYEARKASPANYGRMKDVWSVKLRGPVQSAQFLINESLAMFNHAHWRLSNTDKPATKDLSGKIYYLVRMRRTDDV